MTNLKIGSSLMQNVRKVRTDYKYSMLDKEKTFKDKLLRKSKWPFALGLLTFALVWRIGQWWQIPNSPEAELTFRPSQALIIENTPNPITVPANESPIQLKLLKQEESIIENTTLENHPEDEKQTVVADVLQEKQPISEDTLAATFSAPKTHIEHFTIETGRSLAHYFQKAKLPPVVLHNVLTSIQHSKLLTKIFPGQTLSIESKQPGTLDSLVIKLNPTQELKVFHTEENKFSSTLIEKTIEKKNTFRGGVIKDSLFLTGKRANLPESLIMELAQIFEYDIDFALDIKPNDHFKVLYDEHYVEGQKLAIALYSPQSLVPMEKHIKQYAIQTQMAKVLIILRMEQA